MQVLAPALKSQPAVIYSDGTKSEQYSSNHLRPLTQATAIRPLTIRMNRTWYSAPARLAPQGSRSQVCSRLGVWLLKPHPAYGWDLTKNICELYRTDGRPANTYTYTPYGAVTAARPDLQPLLWSSEYHDAELGLVYYNYRHYNPTSGRWTGRDKARHSSFFKAFLNSPLYHYDYLGLWEQSQRNSYVWKANKGDTLGGLAIKVGGSYDDWKCLWPEKDTKNHGYPHRIHECDHYNTSNLVKQSNTSLHVILSESMFDYKQAFPKAVYVHPNNVVDMIKKVSNMGDTPINDFLMIGHGGNSSEIMPDGSFYSFDVMDITQNADNAPNFENAQKRKGPHRCWFSKSATARFAGCKSFNHIAYDFSQKALRKGAVAYGTMHDTVISYREGKIILSVYINNFEVNNDDFYGSSTWKTSNGML